MSLAGGIKGRLGRELLIGRYRAEIPFPPSHPEASPFVQSSGEQDFAPQQRSGKEVVIYKAGLTSETDLTGLSRDTVARTDG
jgi:hypothetical protein